MSSQAESISAWKTVLDWFSIVAALAVARSGPDRSSAAFRKTAARASQGSSDQSRQASRAVAMASSTSFGPAWW